MTGDILAAIDAAVGCQECGGALGDSPSDDFCGDDCQARWRARHSIPLVGYREPWEDVVGVLPGIGGEQYRPRPLPDPGAEFKLPRSTGDLLADLWAAWRAGQAATTPAQIAAVAVRADALAQRFHVEFAPVYEALADRVAQMARIFETAAESVMRRLTESSSPQVVAPPAVVDNRRERALAVRQERGTGPAPTGRPPRSVGRPATTPQR